MIAKINHQLAHLYDRAWIAAISASHRGHAGRQLRKIKGFDQVVVSTGIQSFNPVRHLIPGGQNDHRCCYSGSPDRSQKAEAMAVGQHQVQQNQVVGCGPDTRLSKAQSLHPVHGVAVVRNLIPDRLAQSRRILHQKNPHCSPLTQP